MPASPKAFCSVSPNHRTYMIVEERGCTIRVGVRGSSTAVCLLCGGTYTLQLYGCMAFVYRNFVARTFIHTNHTPTALVDPGYPTSMAFGSIEHRRSRYEDGCSEAERAHGHGHSTSRSRSCANPQTCALKPYVVKERNRPSYFARRLHH